MIDRRSESRQRSLLGAQITFERWQCAMDCLVRNVSEHGAMVVFPHTTLMPGEFHIHIPQRRATKYAKVIWRWHDRAGLALTAVEPSRLPIDQAKRIRALEAENQRLRRQLAPGSW